MPVQVFLKLFQQGVQHPVGITGAFGRGETIAQLPDLPPSAAPANSWSASITRMGFCADWKGGAFTVSPASLTSTTLFTGKQNKLLFPKMRKQFFRYCFQFIRNRYGFRVGVVNVLWLPSAVFQQLR